ncbi:MAG: head decoration protein [Salinarimonadaceae bacterium]|nr:MAG: head decoration protein [Salinarimonadaceae bacterium]
MTVFTEGRHPGEFLLTEATGSRSRDAIVIASGAGVLAPGTVLGRFTSGANAGKFTASINAAADPDVGQQVAVALLLYGVDATSGDVAVAAITRDAEVNGNVLTYHTSVDDATKRAAKNAQLAAVGIIVR